jgi:hypothetical protein
MEMLFKYYGEIEGLKKEIIQHATKLEKIYLELLGANNFSRLSEISEKILNEKSFISLEEVMEYTLGKPSSLSNKIATEIKEKVKVGRNGKIVGKREINTCVFFIFHEAGFEKSAYDKAGLPKYLTSYLHEFNHYLFYALQENPIPVAMSILHSQIPTEYIPLKIGKILEELMSSSEKLERKQHILILAFTYLGLEDLFEGTTRLLDAYVLEKLGYNVSKYPLPGPKRYNGIFIKPLKIKFVIGTGDPLYGMDLPSRLNILLNWTGNLKFAPGELSDYQKFQKNFINSFSQLKIHKIPFKEIL